MGSGRREPPRGAVDVGPQPPPDRRGERESTVEAPPQHGQERVSHSGAQRQHRQGPLSLLRSQLQFLRLLPESPPPLRRQRRA